VLLDDPWSCFNDAQPLASVSADSPCPADTHNKTRYFLCSNELGPASRTACCFVSGELEQEQEAHKYRKCRVVVNPPSSKTH